MKIGNAISGLLKANINYFKSLIESKKINVQTKYDYTELYKIIHNESQPCFILSTGRCGTALLTKIFEQHSDIDVHHEPVPELVYYSRFAYENRKNLSNEMKYLVDAARYEQVRNAFLLNKTFIWYESHKQNIYIFKLFLNNCSVAIIWVVKNQFYI